MIALWSKSIVLLPDNKLKSKIEELFNIFQQAVDSITIKKPLPEEKESNETLDKYIPEPTPSKKEISTYSAVIDKKMKQHLSVNIPILNPYRYPTRIRVAKAAKSI